MASQPKNLSDAHTACLPLKGRKAVITGATTGIGRAIGTLLASEGVEIFTCGRDPRHLDDGLARMREVGGTADGIALDLAEPGNVDKFFAAAQDKLGAYDIAIMNAAIAAEGLTEMDEDAVRYAVAVDFAAYVLGAHKAAAALGDEGDLILIGSTSAHTLGPSSTVYAGIKAGIAGFAEALRKELGPKGIRVSLIEPGSTGADMQSPEKPPEKQREEINAEKMLRAEDIAVGVHYLLTQPRRTVIQQLSIVPRLQEN